MVSFFFLEAMRKANEFLIKNFDKTGRTAFFPPEQFSWVNEVEKSWEIIRKELDELLKQKEIASYYELFDGVLHKDIKRNDWKVFFFVFYGDYLKENCSKCPKTVEIINKIPNKITAFFSLVEAGKDIPEHRGSYRGFLRYHLGLKIPEPLTESGIRLNNETKYWEEGKSLLFDDSFYHKAWNNTKENKVILIIDIERPLNIFLEKINKFFIKRILKSNYMKKTREIISQRQTSS